MMMRSMAYEKGKKYFKDTFKTSRKFVKKGTFYRGQVLGRLGKAPMQNLVTVEHPKIISSHKQPAPMVM